MPSITIRAIESRTAAFRPSPMPSVQCPMVLDWQTHKRSTQWMCIAHCLACAWAVRIEIENNESGCVHCAGGSG